MKNMKEFNFKTFGESIIYKDKNRSFFKKVFFILLLILISLFISLIIIQMIGYNMFDALETLFTRPFQNFLIKDFMTNISILGLSALAFTISYKSGLFNIGVSGQMIGAGLAIISLSKALTNPDGTSSTGPSGVILTVIVAVSTGMFISLIAGFLRVFLRVYEVVSTILLNWIIFFLSKYLISDGGPLSNPGDVLNSIPVHEDLAFYDSSQLSGFVGALVSLIVVSLFLWVILRYTLFGKKIISVGKSFTASSYAGYNIKTLQLSSFALTGAIAGLLACVVYTGNATRSMPVPLVNLIPIEGFNGIAIALIAFTNPLAIIPVSFIMGMFITAASAAPPFPNSMGLLIIGLIVYGTSIFALLYDLNFLKKTRIYLSKVSNKWNEDPKTKEKIKTKKLNSFINNWNEKYEKKQEKIKNISKTKYNINLEVHELNNEEIDETNKKTKINNLKKGDK